MYCVGIVKGEMEGAWRRVKWCGRFEGYADPVNEFGRSYIYVVFTIPLPYHITSHYLVPWLGSRGAYMSTDQ